MRPNKGEMKMQNSLKSKKIVGIVLIALLIFTTSAYAVNNDSFKTTISTANMQVKKGDTVIVTIGLKDIAIESGEKGIGAYTASIKFDSSVLEYNKTDSTDKWEAPFYQNGLIAGNTKDGEVVNKAEDIGTIIFKVKEDAKLGETTISLNNFSGSTAVTDVPTSDVSVKITVIEDKTDNVNNNNDNDEQNNGSNNKDDNDKNSGSNNKDQNDQNNSGSNNNHNNDQNSESNNKNQNDKNNENHNKDDNDQNSGNDNNQNTDSSNSNNSTNEDSNSNNELNKLDNTIKEGETPKTGQSYLIFIAIGVCVVLIIIFYIKMRKK